MKNYILKNSPTIPNMVYELLPDLLKQLTNEFIEPRERDIILLSSLVVLSSSFNSVRGMYDQQWVHPNLYCFIVAPPASNKGVMRFSKNLGNIIQEKLISTHNDILNQYEMNKNAWNKKSKSNSSSIVEPIPERPKLPLFYIPGNTSSTAMYDRLNDSNGTGIIFETEADVLSGSIKQDWGNFSHFLRSAYHHETVSYLRVSENRTVYINNPRLSILLSGTPNQVPKLISSGEDGLMSRFLFYCFESEHIWKDVTSKFDKIDKEELFTNIGYQIEAYNSILNIQNFIFDYTEEQNRWHFKHFSTKLEHIKDNSDYVSILNRLGLMTFKISMVLSVLRNANRLDAITKLTCSNEDFKAALLITKTLLHHSLLMHSLLPNQNEGNSKQFLFFEKLPKGEEFPRKLANEIGGKIGVSERTVSNYIEALKKQNMLNDVRYGIFFIPDDKGYKK
ncbi:MAG: DUF3987 domain-containing protein [Ferruginibacter sp.]|nr:DUF3987 domain-containing protein [Ferruginibacter sp.]